MKKMIVLAVMAVLGLQAHAQIVSSRSSMVTRQVIDEPKVNINTGWSTFGVEYLPSTWSFDGDSESFTGIAVNYTKAISLTQSIPLFLEWGIGAQYSFKTWNEDEDYEEKIHYASLKVPVNLIYDFRIPNTNINIDPYFGIKFRGNVWGESKWEDKYHDESDSENLFGDEMEWKRFQLGWNIGVKARFNDSFFVGVAYGSDFSEIAKKVHVNEVSLSVGVVF